jgi:hypothetical protein
MSAKANHHDAPPTPGPECAALAPLLPLLSEGGNDTHAEAGVRGHLATCAYCQSQLAAYDRLDDALRRHFGPNAVPTLALEEIMDDIRDLTEEPGSAPVHSEASAPLDRPARGPRRALPAVAAVAAVLLIALLTQLLLAGHLRTTHSLAKGTATPRPDYVAPGIVRGSQTFLRSVSMVSPTEGWAVGQNITSDRPTPIFHYSGGVWTPVSAPATHDLSSISMDSPSDGWAVGMTDMLHYDGHTWSSVPLPATGPEGLSAVQMLSPSEGWAVGADAGTGRPSILHYDGHAWTPQATQSYQAAVTLAAISMVSPTEGWTVGASFDAQGVPTALLLHDSGGRWTLQATLPNTDLRGVAMVWASEGWAVGETDTYLPAGPAPNTPTIMAAPLLLHYMGGRWTAVPGAASVAPLGIGSLSQVAMLSASEGWIVGDTYVGTVRQPDSAPDTTILLHYQAGRWTPVSLPPLPHRRSFFVGGIAMVAGGEAWAVGAAFWPREDGIPAPNGTGYTPTITPLILHEHGGVWSIVMD